MALVAATALAAALPAQPHAAAAESPASAGVSWGIHLEGFFERGPLNLYAVRSGDAWISGLCTATNYANGKAVWNTALMQPDLAAVKVDGGKLAGTASILLIPDPWVPLDQKPRTAVVTLECSASGPAGDDGRTPITGRWSMRIEGDAAQLAAARLTPSGQGEITGYAAPAAPPDVADASYDLLLYNLLPGKTSDNFHRRRGLSIGVRGGRAVSARYAMVDMRHNIYDHETIETPADFRAAPYDFSGTVAFEAMTLDGLPVAFALKVSGRRITNLATGEWQGTMTVEGRPPEPVRGFLRATIRPGAFVATAARDDRPWFAQVAGFAPPAPGEHPRLFFRKADVPELRRRAETPDGKRIIERLRLLLNGSDGRTMPASYNPAQKAYEKNNFKPAPGAYSISHAAGYGFLYQLTGEALYADLARQCVEKAFAGQRNFDDRYAWVAPGGELRAGPSIGWTAAAYDLCYDAWDDAFRRKVALAVQDYDDAKAGEWAKEEGVSLRAMVLQPRQGPGSNHFGAVCGGSGLAVLAIKGDPGTDDDKLSLYLGVLERQVVRHLSAGWGDGGYYKEGWGASTVGTQGGFLCFLQALRTAAGRDYVNVDRPNASYITMVPRCLMMLGPPATFPYRSNMGPTYGSPEFWRERDGFSHGGHFSEGFGAVADRHKPALLWTYQHTVEPDEAKRGFDTPGPYPHRAMLALVNWPTFQGVAEKNPAECMPLATVDHLYDYYVFRNRFKDADDIVATVLVKQPDGTKPRDVMVWGMGLRLALGEPERNAPVLHYAAAADGSGLLATAKFALAVDYSRASGADALVVAVGSAVRPLKEGESAKARLTVIDAGGTSFSVLTLAADARHPEPRADGGRLVIGGQTVAFADGRLTLAKFAEGK
jgi:hypothetical protein